MTGIIQAVLAMITQLLPLVASGGTAAEIEAIVAALTNILPALVEDVQTMVPVVKNIIAALQANPAATADQLAALQALDKQCDDAFDAAFSDVTIPPTTTA